MNTPRALKYTISVNCDLDRILIFTDDEYSSNACVVRSC